MSVGFIKEGSDQISLTGVSFNTICQGNLLRTQVQGCCSQRQNKTKNGSINTLRLP